MVIAEPARESDAMTGTVFVPDATRIVSALMVSKAISFVVNLKESNTHYYDGALRRRGLNHQHESKCAVFLTHETSHPMPLALHVLEENAPVTLVNNAAVPQRSKAFECLARAVECE